MISFAEGSRKVGERRVCQDPTLAQNGLVCLAMLPLQIPFKVFSICVSVVGQSVKRLRRMRPLVLNTILVFFIRNYAHEHDHNFLSRFCWGAKGSRKGGVRAVLGYFEQPHTFHIIPYYCIISSLYPHVVFRIIIYGIIHYIISLSQLFRYEIPMISYPLVTKHGTWKSQILSFMLLCLT